MTTQDNKQKQAGKQPQTDDTQSYQIPKPESSSNYEGAPDQEDTSNPGTETKTETSSSSGE